MEWLIVVVVVVGLFIAFNIHSNQNRREHLISKYGDPKIVDMIMNRKIWQGQTQEQLIDSLGKPVDIDQKVLKSKVKETWKYNQQGRNRFRLRIIVENDIVVGWDQKK